MRVNSRSIPANYYEFDARVTAADAYLNAHDLRRWHENVNILIARRARKPLITQGIFDNTDSKDPALLRSLRRVTANRTSGEICFAAPIWIPPHCAEVEVVLRAAETSAAEDSPEIFAVIDGPNEPLPLDTSLAMTLAGTSEATYRATVPVPFKAADEGMGYLYLYYYTPMYAAAAKAATAITDAGGDQIAWIEGAFGSTYIDFIAACTTNSAIRPRVISFGENRGGGSYRLFFDGPWAGARPVPGTDTFAIYQANKIKLYSVTAYPVELSSFYGARSRS